MYGFQAKIVLHTFLRIYSNSLLQSFSITLASSFLSHGGYSYIKFSCLFTILSITNSTELLLRLSALSSTEADSDMLTTCSPIMEMRVWLIVGAQ